MLSHLHTRRAYLYCSLSCISDYVLPFLIHTLQHTATRCNTLQHTAIHCNTLYRSLTCMHDDIAFSLPYTTHVPISLSLAYTAIWLFLFHTPLYLFHTPLYLFHTPLYRPLARIHHYIILSLFHIPRVYTSETATQCNFRLVYKSGKATESARVRARAQVWV